MRWFAPWLFVACAPPEDAPVVAVPEEPEPVEVVVIDDPVWPEPGAPLAHPVIEVPPGFAKQTVFLVAGHGTPDNVGNLGAWCTREADFALRTTDGLADRLGGTGQFDVVRARTGDERPSYRARLRHLAQSGASAMIELHSDARADGVYANAVAPDGETCWRDDREPGFTILVRDRGPAALVDERLALARALAESLTAAGFRPWFGDNYDGAYDADEVPGVWFDRRGLIMLRLPTVPSVIIETHNAKDGRETLRWEEERTQEAFGRAVLAGLLAFYDR